MTNVLLTLGHGYTASALSRHLLAAGGWQIIGTARSAEAEARLRATGIQPLTWPGDLGPALAQATHILASAAPDANGDPFLAAARPALTAAKPRWVGYLSTTAVYGDHGGEWVDESTPLNPGSARAVARVLAERQWLATGLPVHVFRLAGIYGPGRGPFEKVRSGTARRIIKPGQMFSRIHVEDIAQVLAASMARPDPGAVYNVCDNEPSSPEDVLTYAAHLLGLPPPPIIPYDAAEMTEMARSFYAENKRVRNDRIRHDLGVRLCYPDYRAGLAADLAGQGVGAAIVSPRS